MRDQKNQPPPIFISVTETMRLLSRGRQGVYNLIHDGSIESVKLGGSRRIRYDSVISFANSLGSAPLQSKTAA